MTITFTVVGAMYIIIVCLTIAGIMLWRHPTEALMLLSSAATLSLTAAALIMLGILV